VPCTPSTLEQARRRSLLRSVLLERAAIFGHEENDVLQDSPLAACPCGTGGNGREDPMSQLHTCWEVEAIE